MEIPDVIKDQIDEKGGLDNLNDLVPGMADLKSMSDVFKALADENRLRIMYILLEQDLCVCCIKELVNMPDSKLSYHLNKLKDAGLIEGVQDKNWIIYKPTAKARSVLS